MASAAAPQWHLRVFPNCRLRRGDATRNGVSKIWRALKDAEQQREPLRGEVGGGEEAALSALQRAAIAALLTHGRPDAVARFCGVPLETLEGWMREPAFVAAYFAARRAARTHAAADAPHDAAAGMRVMRR